MGQSPELLENTNPTPCETSTWCFADAEDDVVISPDDSNVSRLRVADLALEEMGNSGEENPVRDQKITTLPVDSSGSPIPESMRSEAVKQVTNDGKREVTGITIGKAPPEAPEIVKLREELKDAKLLVEGEKLAMVLHGGNFDKLSQKDKDAIVKAFQDSSDPAKLAEATSRMLKMNGSPYSLVYEKHRDGQATLALEKDGKDEHGRDQRFRTELVVPRPEPKMPWRPLPGFEPLPRW